METRFAAHDAQGRSVFNFATHHLLDHLIEHAAGFIHKCTLPQTSGENESKATPLLMNSGSKYNTRFTNQGNKGQGRLEDTAFAQGRLAKRAFEKETNTFLNHKSHFNFNNRNFLHHTMHFNFNKVGFGFDVLTLL